MKIHSVNISKFWFILWIVFGILHPENSTAQNENDSLITRKTVPDSIDYFTGDIDLNLCTAAYDGNSAAVLALLNKGANVDYSADGRTALHYAIFNGNLDITKILVLNGSDINRPADEGQTPLIMAVRNGRDEITDFLCQHGALIDSSDDNHRTALMFAIANGSFLLADLLLYYGANLYLKDFGGNDAFMLATYTNQPDLAAYLHSVGADINTRDSYNNTPLIVAAEKSYSEMIDSLIIWGADARLKNNTGNTALAKAINEGNLSNVTTLVNKFGTVNESIRPGIRPLDLAKSNPGIDSILRKAGAHRSLIPYYSEMLIGFDFASNFSDYMNNMHIGLYDPKKFTSISLGFHTRMAAMKLYVPKSDIVWYQYRERRYFIYAAIDKQIPVSCTGKWGKCGLAIGLKGGYTFGNYRGSSADAASEWLLVPSAQFFYSARNITISSGYEYAKYPCFELSPHHLTASIKFHFPFRKESTNYKSVFWIQTNP
jgi:ankyrin repeat protein